MNKLLTAKALGILFCIASTGVRISAENLAKVFGEGEKAMGSGLKELRLHGLIELKHERINGQVVKYSKITDAGWELIAHFLRMPAPEAPYSYQEAGNRQNGGIDSSNEQLSKLTLNISKYKPNTLEQKTTTIQSKSEATNGHLAACQNCTVRPTPLDLRLEAERQKQVEYDSKQTHKHKVAIEKRQGRSRDTWSISDVCMEIADTAANLWNLPPWRLSNSRLVAAMTQMRRKWGTNGEQEMHAFEFFLRRVNTKEYPSVDALWQSFIYQFPEILPKIEAIFPNKEKSEQADEVAKAAMRKALEELREENDTESRAREKQKDSKRAELKHLEHHFSVMTDESKRDKDKKKQSRYLKKLIKIRLDLALLANDKSEINRLEEMIANMEAVEDIPEGELII
jgi:DNA-binding PadR family transcriptional regulator